MTSRRLPEKEFILIEWFVEGEQCAIYRLSEDGSERLLGSFVSRGQLEDGKAFPLALSDGSTVRVQMQDGEPRVLKNDSLLLPVSVPDRLAIEWHARHGKKNNSEVTPAIAAATIGIVGVFFLIAGILSYIFGGSGVFGLGPSGLLLANIVLGLVFFLLAWLAYRGLFFTAMLALIIYVPVSVIGIIYACISTVEALAAEAGATAAPGAAMPVWGLITNILVRFCFLALLWGVATRFSRTRKAQADAEKIRAIRARVLCYQVEGVPV